MAERPTAFIDLSGDSPSPKRHARGSNVDDYIDDGYGGIHRQDDHPAAAAAAAATKFPRTMLGGRTALSRLVNGTPSPPTKRRTILYSDDDDNDDDYGSISRGFHIIIRGQRN